MEPYLDVWISFNYCDSLTGMIKFKSTLLALRQSKVFVFLVNNCPKSTHILDLTLVNNLNKSHEM